MAQQPGSNGNPLFDLVCVIALGVLLWLGAQAVGATARTASPHPISREPTKGADPSPLAH
jgi:hypothetical protein